MSFFGNIFSDSSSNEEVAGFKFGRYTDANKPDAKLDLYDVAVNHFKDKKYLDCYDAFFNYLRDESLDNVHWNKSGDSITFDLIQGSKTVKGHIKNGQVYASVEIAKYRSPVIAVFRRLLADNFYMKYSRLAIDNNTLCVVFNTSYDSCSPSKLYWGLREMSTKADKLDDLLIDEFKDVQAIDDSCIIEYEDSLKDLKYKYLIQWINQTLEEVAKFDEMKFSGAYSFMLLSLAYRIDYLLVPEGVLANAMEDIQRTYFARDEKPYVEKNRALIEQYKKILAKDPTLIKTSFYETIHTFGMVQAAPHSEVADFVVGSLEKVVWYKENNHHNVVRSVYEYAAGYSLFNFGMYQSTIDLFDIVMYLMHPQYYKEFGLNYNFLDSSGRIDKYKVEEKIRKIVRKEQKQYPQFDIDVSQLKYTSVETFCESLYGEFNNMNL